MGYHFGGCTTHFGPLLWDWHVHWGYDLGFDPWPFVVAPPKKFSETIRPLLSGLSDRTDSRQSRELRLQFALLVHTDEARRLRERG